MDRLERLARTVALAVSLAAVSASAATSSAFDVREVLAEPFVMKSFAGLMRDCAMGSDVEAAAFLVRAEDGSMSTIVWDATTAHRQQNWSGRIPAGTVAIVHTHPARLERPSTGDVTQALRLRMPIYVLTRSAIRAIDGRTGEQVALVKGQFWVRDASR